MLTLDQVTPPMHEAYVFTSLVFVALVSSYRFNSIPKLVAVPAEIPEFLQGLPRQKRGRWYERHREHGSLTDATCLLSEAEREARSRLGRDAPAFSASSSRRPTAVDLPPRAFHAQPGEPRGRDDHDASVVARDALTSPCLAQRAGEDHRSVPRPGGALVAPAIRALRTAGRA